MATAVAAERAQKILAHIGIGSRRQLEAKIQAGRLSLYGKTLELGSKISWGDPVALDGKQVVWPNKTNSKRELLLYHKPVGQICSRNDPEGRVSVFSKLPKPKFGRWLSVGRLDINSAGLLLFTNDGALAQELMHPSFGITRTYLVRIYGEQLTAAMLNQLRKGIMLADGLANFKSIKYARGSKINHWYEVKIAEGRNREVRRMFAAVDAKINKLLRIGYGDWTLPRNLQPGEFVRVKV